MRGIIYCYTSPNGKKYIGQTQHEERRRKDFLKSKDYAGAKINRAIEKYGPNSFKYNILLEINEDKQETLIERLNEAEKYFINKYDTINKGYNIEEGGLHENLYFNDDAKERMIKSLKEYYATHPNPFKGKHHSEETKKILRKKSLGRPSPFKGKHWNEEQRKKISERVKIQCKGENNPFYGKKHTDKTKKTIGDKNSKSVVQIDKNTYEIINVFRSALDAGLYFGKPRSNSEIIKVCSDYVSPSNRHYKTSLGFYWRYKKDIEGSTTIEIDGKEYYRPKVEYDSSESEMGSPSENEGEDIVSTI